MKTVLRFQVRHSPAPYIVEHVAHISTGHAHADEADRQDELDEYYTHGCHFGVPASVTLFQLAHTMQLGSPYVLW